MIEVNNQKFEIIEETEKAIDLEVLSNYLTDYFNGFDYIVGDWAYGKLRLKGFNQKDNKNFNNINDYSMVKKYIEDYCAFGCKYFIIKRIKVD